jgi:hypothetical protein
MPLKFIKASTKEDIKKVYNYNLDAFSSSPGFHWNLKNINNEIDNGWNLYAVNKSEETIAAIFLKKEGKNMHSKNTSIKMMYQGSGHSHEIKEFIETNARENKCSQVTHYCEIDDFRTYSLNESHGYKKLPEKSHDGTIVIWEKVLKK